MKMNPALEKLIADMIETVDNRFRAYSEYQATENFIGNENAVHRAYQRYDDANEKWLKALQAFEDRFASLYEVE